ncbi:MAG: alanine:cation symporter family protein [Bacteroidales bacterium]|nr:alanine:cation symporter family protein [Bacteroidales bacterium]
MIRFYEYINNILSNYVLIVLLLAAAIFFTVRTRGVQFRMFGEMIRLLCKSGRKDNDKRANEDSHKSITSFQAFVVSIASRVGVGNLAGVAAAIAIGGPGAVFWMWVIALLGAATAFIESTLAQLYKVQGPQSYIGGPAYYIQHGLHQRWWAVTFAVLITITFGIAFSAVQSQTIADAVASSFGVPLWVTGLFVTFITAIVIFGGIQSIARVSQWVVPIMALGYIFMAIAIIIMNITNLPHILALVVENAFGVNQALGGTMGMAMIWGIKRGLFSNEAGEGSTPNAAATAAVSHPVKQGLIQALGVFTDTMLVCTSTAFIILCSGVWTEGFDGIVLTQHAIDKELGMGGAGSIFVATAIFFFAFTSILANTYYSEANLMFIKRNKTMIFIFRCIVVGIVMLGAVTSLDTVWGFADITMALMTICNLCAIALLGKYAIRCMKDYQKQKRAGKDPEYFSSTIPEIAEDTPCWHKDPAKE